MHPHVSTLSVLERGNCAFALVGVEKFGFGTKVCIGEFEQESEMHLIWGKTRKNGNFY
jgi:hypothetical protein